MIFPFTPPFSSCISHPATSTPEGPVFGRAFLVQGMGKQLRLRTCSDTLGSCEGLVETLWFWDLWKLLSDFRKHKPHPSWYLLEPVASLGWPTVHWRRSQDCDPKIVVKIKPYQPISMPHSEYMDGLSMFIQVEFRIIHGAMIPKTSYSSYSQVPSQSDPWFDQGLVYRPVAGTATSSCLCALLDLLMSAMATHDEKFPPLNTGCSMAVKGVAPQELDDATLIKLCWNDSPFKAVFEDVWRLPRCFFGGGLLQRSPNMFEG